MHTFTRCCSEVSTRYSCLHAFYFISTRELYELVCAGCNEGDVRLVEGATRLEGRVEICKDNEWGTVCQTNWEVAEARVVCRQLGLSVAGIVITFHVAVAS